MNLAKQLQRAAGQYDDLTLTLRQAKKAMSIRTLAVARVVLDELTAAGIVVPVGEGYGVRCDDDDDDMQQPLDLDDDDETGEGLQVEWPPYRVAVGHPWENKTMWACRVR